MWIYYLLFATFKYIELITYKIAEQENQFEQSILEFNDEENLSNIQIQNIVKQQRLTWPEMRIIATKAVGQAWYELVTQRNRAIEASWESSGLNLNISGHQDKDWYKKMAIKYTGKELEWVNLKKEGKDYSKLRVYSKAFNTQGRMPPDPNKLNHTENDPMSPQNDNQLYSKNFDAVMRFRTKEADAIERKKSKKINPDKIDLCLELPTLQTFQKSGTILQYFEREKNNNNQKSTTKTIQERKEQKDDEGKEEKEEQFTFDFYDWISQFRYVGLKNVYGNNCYENSWLQALALIPQIELRLPISRSSIEMYKYRKATQEIDQITPTTYDHYCHIINSLYTLLTKIKNPSKIQQEDICKQDVMGKLVSINPKQFVDALPAPWNGREQQDVNEFHLTMTKIIKSISLNSNYNNSISDLFEFHIQQTITCNVCKNYRITRCEPHELLKVMCYLFVYYYIIRSHTSTKTNVY